MTGGYARTRRYRFAGLLAGLAVTFVAMLPAPAALAQEAVHNDAAAPALQVFVREGCPHCAEAKAYLDALADARPTLAIDYRWVDRDAGALDELARHSREAGAWPPGVPTFVYDGAVLVGFDSAEHTGPRVLALLEHQRVAPGTIETGWFGTLSVSRLGLPAFTLAVGLLDGFNPCAMWVLLFLLSLLVRLQDRRRMALIAGTFVLVSGLVYYAFMAAWLNLFLVIGLTAAVRYALAAVAIAIGAINVKDFVAGVEGVSLSIPESAKPGLYARMRAVVRADNLPLALVAASVLAVVVNFVELLCTAGLPAMYTAILTQQGLSTAANLGYLALYILGYMADDGLMVAMAVIALSSRKLTERTGRWLKLLSGLVMLALGLVMAVRPEWLT